MDFVYWRCRHNPSASVQMSGHSSKSGAEASSNSYQLQNTRFFMKWAIKRASPVLAFSQMEFVTLWIKEPALLSQSNCWPIPNNKLHVWHRILTYLTAEKRDERQQHTSLWNIPWYFFFSLYVSGSLLFHHWNWLFAGRKSGNTSEELLNTDKKAFLKTWDYGVQRSIKKHCVKHFTGFNKQTYSVLPSISNWKITQIQVQLKFFFD